MKIREKVVHVSELTLFRASLVGPKLSSGFLHVRLTPPRPVDRRIELFRGEINEHARARASTCTLTAVIGSYRIDANARITPFSITMVMVNYAVKCVFCVADKIGCFTGSENSADSAVEFANLSQSDGFGAPKSRL